MATTRRDPGRVLLAIGAATAAAHIGNNFTTYLIGGLIDHYGFTPIQMGAWSMTESLAYAAAMFLLAPRAATLSPRTLGIAAGLLVIAAQVAASATAVYPLLVLTRVITGVGFGIANAAVNLAAGRTASPARAISLGITVQTAIYAAVNIGLPIVGQARGVGGMFLALALLSALLLIASLALPRGGALKPEPGRVPRSTASPPDQARVLVAMALFTFGSLAIWPFMERAGHAIGITAVEFGRFQSLATLASAFGSLLLALVVARLARDIALLVSLLTCGLCCWTLTHTEGSTIFAVALVGYNVSWFMTYPLLLGIGFAVDQSGQLAVRCSAVWLLMMSLGSLTTGVLAQLLGGFAPAGGLGLAFCAAAIVAAWPIARRADRAIAGDLVPH